MLVRLAIRDIVLIDRLDLTFDAGLSVLTGETGAGKSILLDAFALALGGRGDASLVRHGSEQGQVTAVFDVAADHPARLLLKDGGLEDDGDLILRRVQYRDGRTRGFVNDQPVGVQLLRAIGERLVEIHGQHDDRALVDPATHRALIDAFGGHGELVREVGEAHAAFARARRALAEHAQRVEAARKEADFLRHAADELSKLGPEPGEEADLAARRQAMQAAEKVAQDLIEAQDAVSGQGSPIAQLSAALRRLERRATQAPALIEPPAKAIDAALVALDEAAAALERALSEAAFDPRDLERTEERLFALRAASRKYSAPCDDLPALAERFASELATIDAGEERLVALGAEVEAAERAYVGLAGRLSERRGATAAALDAAVLAELAPLKLERARFLTQVTRDDASRTAEGFDRVEFWVQTNPGTRPGPLMKIASGGELSRFMLALKVVLADRGSAPTLVFDEIDSGAGGAVADAIGQRLKRLSGRVQALCVTHAPQVAARAFWHFLISKSVLDGADAVVTRVETLDETARREEIARMLAGETITQEARAAAARLIEAAGA